MSNHCAYGDKIKFCSRRFCTREELQELIEDVKNFCLSKGYATSIKNSRKDRCVTIGCDRGGIYRDRHKISIEKKPRGSSTRLINCPFTVHGKRQSDGFWVLHLKNASHNHEPSSEMSGHPFYCRLKRKRLLILRK